MPRSAHTLSCNINQTLGQFGGIAVLKRGKAEFVEELLMTATLANKLEKIRTALPY
jgi:hypothetical protein